VPAKTGAVAKQKIATALKLCSIAILHMAKNEHSVENGGQKPKA
jgi:hypothetical protein